ncbi:glycerol-3-phosphate dehydrogenase/oxidase [Mycolicibacterium helvum]|uniref:Glycerol-3-phosphate dehydrogenase n=1 Tax=Mycolicibacterium helvum TaxID=1534349 RepID=A0A7I7SZH9_9MYCO|nr:glycerol-3-phosphate dehydrogenase/oxidase [Mycolicibacterium helvum]BBY62060.1 glycerol-3-phosphate dehydrogenase [Mycolicibacterium helvum]
MNYENTQRPGRLSRQQRIADRARAETEIFDVAVIGGGITGVGVALDAESRGLSAVLLEADDYASGTSSKSSKLIHGGLRYLEMLDFALVREALRERKLLLETIAPHLVKPVPLIWPLTHRVWERGYLGAGLALYDSMGGAGAVPVHRHLSKRRMRRTAPGLDPQAYVGGIQFYDAIEDDARYAMTVARTAAERGAAMLTKVRATGLSVVGGRVCGVHARDMLTDTEFDVQARHVVVAAGPWAGHVLEMIPGRQADFAVRPSKGIHIVVPGDRIESEAGVLMRTEKSVLFVIPWDGHWLIGDTDTEWREDTGTPLPTRVDVEYLLSKVNSILKHPLSTDDIEGVFAGLRPLVHSGDEVDTTKISREHSISTPLPGISVIAGGKYTTYRVMAKDVMDVVADDLRVGRPSATSKLPLVGARGYRDLLENHQKLAGEAKMTPTAVKRLLNRYGDVTEELLSLVAADPALGAPLAGAAPYTRVEAMYAFLCEGALTVADVLERRTRIRIQCKDAGLACVEDVAAIGGQVLGWSPADQMRQVRAYKASVTAQRTAMREDTDRDAVAAFTRFMDNPKIAVAE